MDRFNQERFQCLDTTKYSISAIDNEIDIHTGTVTINNSPKTSANGSMRNIVDVAVNERVMIILNVDVADGLSNGVVGTVIAVEATSSDVHTILIQFDRDRVENRAKVNSPYKQVYV